MNTQPPTTPIQPAGTVWHVNAGAAGGQQFMIVPNVVGGMVQQINLSYNSGASSGWNISFPKSEEQIQKEHNDAFDRAMGVIR